MITKETTIGELLNNQYERCPDPHGDRHALSGLPASQGESLEEAAMVHGIDADLLVEKINAFLKANE